MLFFVEPSSITDWIFQRQSQQLTLSETPVEKATPLSTGEPTRSPLDTSDWKVYRSEEYGFELRYPSAWLVEELSTSDVGHIMTLKTQQGAIAVDVSPTAPAYFEQACPRAVDGVTPEIETIQVGSITWQACLTKPEGFSIPRLYTPLVSGRYIVFSGGLESERLINVKHVSDYPFTVLAIIQTVRFAE